MANAAPTPVERTPEEWEAILREQGEPPYRARQIFKWIHQRGVLDPSAMTDLSKALRERLSADRFDGGMAIDSEHASEDGTRKLILRLHDTRTIETVLIPQGATEDDEIGGEQTDETAPITQCISTQVGCAMGCVFCASGIAGLKRHLSAGEIVLQVLHGRRLAGRVRNVVLMGMGEPLHNYDAVARALRLLFHPEGIGISTRRVTLSTSGLVPEIDRLGRDFDGKVQLAVSIHAPDDERRSSLMPINKKYPLAEVVAAMKRYPLAPRRRITVEYTLVRGFNDSIADAAKLAALFARMRVKVNLIPMNPIADNPLGAPSWETVEAFHDRLWDGGIPTFVRRRKGDDIAAACGQLALAGERKRNRVPLPTV